MATSTLHPANIGVSLSEFLSVVKGFSNSSAFQDVEAFKTDFDQLAVTVKDQERMMMEKNDELVRMKQEYRNKISELFQVHRDEMQKLTDANTGLQSKLDRMQGEVDEQKSLVSDLNRKTQDLEVNLVAEKKERGALTDQHESVKLKNSSIEIHLKKLKDLLQDREGQVKDQTTKIKNQDVMISELRKKHVEVEAKLQENAAVIKRVHRLAPMLSVNNVPEVALSLNTLWHDFYKAISKCFDTNIATTVLEDEHSWKALRGFKVLPSDLPLPPSNVMPAKRVRAAAVMAVLASLLVEYIFTPSYILSKDHELQHILFHLATTDPERESFLRRVIHNTAGDKQKGIKDQRTSKVLELMTDCVQLLLDENVTESLRIELSQLLATAADLWTVVQRKKSYFEADVEIDVDDAWKWRAVRWREQGFDIVEQETAPGQPRDPDACLVLFPRIYVVTDSADQPVFPGVVLPRSEIRAAREEWDKIRQSKPMLGRSSTNRSTRSRRDTLHSQNGVEAPFLGRKDS